MSEELDNTAAEYVLGTLPADERARFAEEMRRDSVLRAEVSRLRVLLAPLDETAPVEMPRPEVWQAIERLTISASADGAAAGAASPQAAAAGSNVVELRRRVTRWRGATFVAGALAAALAVVVVIDRTSVQPALEGGRYVAVVDTGGHEPALIAEVDTKTGIIRVRSVQAETPAGKSLELWHVPDGQAPKSLGILKAGLNAQTVKDLAGPVNGIIAVSVEPEGGSPTGAPTGPVVYTGKLIPVE
jgi:anti-sigma-K factor RskA